MRDDEIVVSVIMLSYNHSKYIAQAIESVVDQKTTFKYEILIGDDASQDGSGAIINSYAARYPELIRATVRERNIGATNNLCDLLRQATGKYIASCECDDFWNDSEKLQIQVDFLEKNKEFCGCFHECAVINQDNEPIHPPKWMVGKAQFSIKDFKGIYLPGHPLSWVYRNIYSDMDLDIIKRAHPVIADRTIAMLALAKGPFARIDKKMGCYRSIIKEGESNATSTLFSSEKAEDKISSKVMEYKLTWTLEEYARERLGLSICFRGFRHTLVCKALVHFLRAPSRTGGRYLADMFVEYKSHKG